MALLPAAEPNSTVMDCARTGDAASGVGSEGIRGRESHSFARAPDEVSSASVSVERISIKTCGELTYSVEVTVRFALTVCLPDTGCKCEHEGSAERQASREDVIQTVRVSVRGRGR